MVAQKSRSASREALDGSTRRTCFDVPVCCDSGPRSGRGASSSPVVAVVESDSVPPAASLALRPVRFRHPLIPSGGGRDCTRRKMGGGGALPASSGFSKPSSSSLHSLCRSPRRLRSLRMLVPVPPFSCVLCEVLDVVREVGGGVKMGERRARRKKRVRTTARKGKERVSKVGRHVKGGCERSPKDRGERGLDLRRPFLRLFVTTWHTRVDSKRQSLCPGAFPRVDFPLVASSSSLSRTPLRRHGHGWNQH